MTEVRQVDAATLYVCDSCCVVSAPRWRVIWPAIVRMEGPRACAEYAKRNGILFAASCGNCGRYLRRDSPPPVSVRDLDLLSEFESDPDPATIREMLMAEEKRRRHMRYEIVSCSICRESHDVGHLPDAAQERAISKWMRAHVKKCPPRHRSG